MAAAASRGYSTGSSSSYSMSGDDAGRGGVDAAEGQGVNGVVGDAMPTASSASPESTTANSKSRNEDDHYPARAGQDMNAHAGEVAMYPVSNGVISSPAASSTHLPKQDSLSSFTTAPDRNSTVSTTTGAASSSAAAVMHRRDTVGSTSMARIAEEGSNSPSATPSASSPPMEPRDASSPASMAGPSHNDNTETLALSPSTTTAQVIAPRPSSPSLSSSSSSARPGGAEGRNLPTTARPDSIAQGQEQQDDITTPSLLQPISTSTSTSINAPTSPSQSPPSRSSGPRVGVHSTLVDAARQAGERLDEHTNNAQSTRSMHSSSQSILSPSNDANQASSDLASTSASSSTPRPAMPVVAGNSASARLASDSSPNPNERPSKAKEVFKAPFSVSPSASPALPGAYPQSYSSPNLQRNSSQQHEQQEYQDNGSQSGEPRLRAPTRYSHAGVSSTHPPVTASSHHAAAMQVQRSSAPILVPPLPANAYAYSNAKDNSFVASPINMLNDAGFGSSSPYPPIGGAQQQRYSLPVQASSVIPNFSQPFPLHNNAALAATASLRPQPTMNYNTPGSSKHLPEMHPSALEARPSISAPFPPSSSPPRNTMKNPNNATIAAPAALQQRERPDTSRPLGQEICLECLMRDRDMADVEVTGPGVWSRNSDIDFEEALRAEEIANSNAQYQNNGMNGNYAGSSIEDHIEQHERRSQMTHNNNNGTNGIAGGSTDENYPHMPPPQSQNGRYPLARDGGQIRSPSRESSVSEGGSRGYRRQPQPPRRRLGIHDPLSSASLKLWTQMNHVSSAHRYKVLSDFVQEQSRLLEQERRAYEQSVLERDRADRALRDSPAKMSMETRSSGFYGMPGTVNGGATSPKLLDLRRSSKSRMPSTQYLPNGMMVETIDVQWDEKEAKARAKAASKGHRGSSHSPNEQRKSFAPSVKSINALTTNALTTYKSHGEAVPSPTGSFVPPWMTDEKRRFSSPMLSSKYGNASSDNLPRPKQYTESNQDLRLSSHSLMTPPLRGLRSPSPSRQSFQTGISQRDSRGWRRSLWPRSASASVRSFPQSGSMMEMHLGMSQDKHEPMPEGYSHDMRGAPIQNGGAGGAMHAPGGIWPDNASEPGGHEGINPDENVEAAKTKNKKKKRFQKLFNSLLGTHHDSDKVASKNRPNEQVEQYAARENGHTNGAPGQRYAQQQYQQQYQQQQQQQQQQQIREAQRRKSSFSYATAAYQDDGSEPLAPPPPLSYLTGQQPHARSYSSSSQTSVTSPGPGMQPQQQQFQDQAALYNGNTRPNSLTVPRNNTNSSNGFVSPSTSSSDLNRNRPSSVTSWRSSSNKTGSPQSPRELLSDSFGHPLPAIRQASFEGMAPDLRVVAGVDLLKEADIYKLRREKSLPALPPGELDGTHPPMPGQDFGLQQQMPKVPYQHGQGQYPQAVQLRHAPVHSIAPSTHEIYTGSDSPQHYPSAPPGDSPEWDYNNQPREYDYDGANSIGKASKKSKVRSRLFSFGGKKNRSSTSPPPPPLQSHPHPPQQSYTERGYAPHEAALQAVVRDPGEMVAYRYPSTTSHA